jgi:serine/threonine protein kinase
LCASALLGFNALHEAIYRAAVNAKDPDTREKVIGQQVPSSYLGLQKVLEAEVAQRRESGVPPVLTQQEFTKLTDKIPENDILDDEDLALAAQFLHDNGVLLHYNDHLRGLNNLYFIDPAWLCDMLAEVIAVPEKGNFIRNGTLAEANVAFLFRDTKKFPPQYLSQYLQLLERFEIALSLGDGTRLIPSMLSVDAPAFNFAFPSPASHQTLSANELGPPVCVKRRYLMVYVPSGFWSRLITRIMINLKRTGLVDPNHRRSYGDAVYWRRGIFVSFNGGKFLVKSIERSSTLKDYVASINKVADGVPEIDDLQGLELTVWSIDGEDFSAVGYIVDQVESLIDEWFPGLKNTDAMGHVLFEREAVWVVPEHLKKRQPDPEEPGREAEEEEVDFMLEDCALQARKSKTIYNAEYQVNIPLEHLVPELLLTDLPEEFKMTKDSLEYNPEDFGTLLGVGGAGAVYRGKYNDKTVAIKRFLTNPEAERIYEQLEYGTSRRSAAPPVTNVEALQLFKDVRQEVTVLSCLDSPYVVKLLGVCLDPLFMATELAPQGSLFSLLEKKREAIQTQQGETAISQIPKMPGGVLGHEITTRISLQVAIALSYLHEQGIVYRDLKGDNVLVWSIDPTHKVNVKLADYGISRFANPGGVKGEEGTPGYMAPEALKKRGEDQSFDEKVDIFAYAMFLYELLTGVRTFEDVENVSEINRLVLRGERPRILEYNADPVFPSMNDLMFDCWKQAAADRPSAIEIISRLSEPGFLCRKHCITNINGHPVPQVFQAYTIPRQEDQPNVDFNSVWMWSKKDAERNFSILNASRGVFSVVEKISAGGRVYCMTATGEINKRLWVGTAAHEIHVFEQGPNVVDSQMLWTYTLKKGDSVLDLTTEVSKGRVRVVHHISCGLCVCTCMPPQSYQCLLTGLEAILNNIKTFK